MRGKAMNWQKLGQIFCADGQHDWMVSHAANPVAEHLADDEYRVYFSCRDAKSRSHIAYVDIELKDPVRVLRVAEEPVVVPGPPGAFDDSGSSMGCLVHDGSRTLLYYLGWNLGVTVPWRNSIGLAVRSAPGGPFVKRSLAPLLDRCDADPYTLSYPCVVGGGDDWRMWYGSNLSWGQAQSDMNHVIKAAASGDGIAWERDGAVVLDFAGPDEYALCRPWVVRDDDCYRMWFCHRGSAYRLGLAESTDAIHWQRRPEGAGLEAAAEGWDSEMIAYPSICDHRGKRFLFYNGNRYGKTGFGVAVQAA